MSSLQGEGRHVQRLLHREEVNVSKSKLFIMGSGGAGMCPFSPSLSVSAPIKAAKLVRGLKKKFKYEKYPILLSVILRPPATRCPENGKKVCLLAVLSPIGQ